MFHRRAAAAATPTTTAPRTQPATSVTYHQAPQTAAANYTNSNLTVGTRRSTRSSGNAEAVTPNSEELNTTQQSTFSNGVPTGNQYGVIGDGIPVKMESKIETPTKAELALAEFDAKTQASLLTTQEELKMETSEPEELGDRLKQFWKNRPPMRRITIQQGRRRLNAKLRKVLKPKSPLVILNQLNMNPNFTVSPLSKDASIFTASAEVGGITFEGTGTSISSAKTEAAEKILTSIIVKKLEESNEEDNEIAAEDDSKELEKEAVEGEEQEQQTPPARFKRRIPEDDFPWGVFGSFAVHKLMENWKMSGIGTPNVGLEKMFVTTGGHVEKKKKTQTKTVTITPFDEPIKIPANTIGVHPGIIVNQMFPGMKFTDTVEKHPPNIEFGSIVEIKNIVFFGKGTSKKEAKRKCCEKILQHYNVPYMVPEVPMDTK